MGLMDLECLGRLGREESWRYLAECGVVEWIRSLDKPLHCSTQIVGVAAHVAISLLQISLSLESDIWVYMDDGRLLQHGNENLVFEFG